jgi:3-hydroxyethyl bacteriochlorophyllide a dehydrogenase
MSFPTHTQAIIFTRPLRAEYVQNVRLPAMDDDGVMIHTEYTTISRGTELDLYTGQMHGKGLNTQWYPMLPGYMPVGVVEAIGRNVTHVKVGDRVVGSNLFSSFDERYCTAWAGHMGTVVISRESHSSLAGKRAVLISPAIPAERAGLAMLGGVAWHGVREKVKPQPGELVLVIGQGVIGNFAAQLCRAMGARVIVADQFENRLAMAKANGLSETIQTDGKSLAAQVREYTGGEAPNTVIEVSGEMEPLRQALEIVKPYGKVHAQGMYLDAAPPELLRTLFNKNLTLSCTVGETPELTGEVVQMMAEGRVNTEGMISVVASPDQATEVYDNVYRHPDKYVTCAFRW